MGKRRKDLQFLESAELNTLTYQYYYDLLKEIGVSVFDYENLPKTIDPRFLEMTLFEDGKCLFFNDEVMGYLSLKCAVGGTLDVYNIPDLRRAYSNNGYQNNKSINDSVIIYNNKLRTNSVNQVRLFAYRLSQLDRAIDVNTNAQKTPVLIVANSETQRLTMKNLYMQYDGNQPYIFADKDCNYRDGISAIKTDAPFVADKLYELKQKYWNEALTFLGVPNITEQKKERLVVDEVTRGMGGVIANRFSRLESRQEAIDKINEMFNLDIKVKYKDTTSAESDGKSYE